MTNADDTYEDEYSEYDEFDDDGEGGLSGFSVLVIGLVMLGAFVAITGIAYQQGIKRGENNGTPYVAADPEPIKIESADTSEPVDDREVYDVFDGEDDETPTILAEGPEEPVDRDSNDPIASIAAGATEVSEDVVDEVNDRIASIAEEDASALNNDASDDNDPEPVAATEPTPVSTAPVDTRPIVRTATEALSGSHVVQVGAFRSDAEAKAQWGRMQSRLGDYLDGKSFDVEAADLGDRGVYHRLRIGPFSSSDAAKDYCTGLKERGQDCLIKGV